MTASDRPTDRPRVLVLSMSPVLSRRAPAVQVANMAQAFAEQGFDVLVVTPTDDPTVRDIPPEELLGFIPSFRRIALSRRVHRGQSYVHALRIARLVVRERIGLLHTRNLRACVVPAMRGVPTILEAHTLSGFEGRQDRWFLRRLLRAPGFRGVVAISQGLAEDLAERLAVPRDRILVAHDAVRIGPDTPVSDDTTTPVPGAPLEVGYTGSLYTGRGVELLLTVAERAPWLRLHLVGGPEDAARALRDRLAASGAPGRVVVHGLVTPAQARVLQAGFDVLVAPFERRVLTDSGVDSSRWMSPMKIFEYMASGRPMIVSDLPVLREVLRPEVHALMVPPEDVDALVAAIARLRDDPALRRRLAASALDRARSEFTWERRVTGILARFVVAPRRTVAIVLASFGSGGAERVLLNLAGALVERGVRVRLLVLDARGPLAEEVDPRVTVVDLQRRRVRTAGPRLLRELRRGRPDAVLASQTHVSLLIALLRPALRPMTRMVLRAPQHRPGAGADGLADRVVARLLSRADAVVASSEAMAADLRRRIGARTTVAVVANPVAVERLRSGLAPIGGIGRMGAIGPGRGADDRIHAVAVGRLVPEKGHADLLDALAEPAAHRVRLDVIGDGPLRAALTEQVRRLRLDDRVTFLGRIDDRSELAARVAHADVLVQPSRVEGMPNSVLEALALGTPVVATEDLVVLREIAEEAHPGAVRLVPRRSLARALAEVPRRTAAPPRPSLLPERFSISRVVDRMLALLLLEDA